MILHTVGHGRLCESEFVSLVRGAGTTEVVDVRMFPGSRRNPQFRREDMELWLPESGTAYRWMPALGGRRRSVPDSRHTALRHPSFRAYADYMETDDFRDGIDELLALGDQRVVMCSESLWWRCHRRLIADYVSLLRDVEVLHLMPDGRQTPHRPTEGVRVLDGTLVYDVTTG